MNKKNLITLIFAIVILITFSFGTYDIITAYNKESFSDDISMGFLGVAFRISLLLPVIIAEISMLFDAVSFISNRIGKIDFMFILHIISFGVSAVVIIFSVICYMGSTDKIFQILLLSSIIALLLVKLICGFLNSARRRNTNKK